MADARFFKNIPEKTIQPIEVRGDVFRILAVAIMDNLKSGISLPDAALKKILDRFAVSPDTKKYLPLEPETVGALAFVLRQIAVKEALENPTLYQKLFEGLNRKITKVFLLQSDTSLHPCVLEAVARALNITITLSIKTPEEELRARQVLNNTERTSPFNVTLQVQEDRYLPCVRNQAYFTAIGQLPVNTPQPVVETNPETIAPELDEIALSNDALWQKYQEYCTRLSNTAKANGLTSLELALLYAESEFLPDQASTRFFADLEKQHHRTIVRTTTENLEQQIVKKIIKAFAGSLSTQHIDEDKLFDAMEQPSYRRTSKVG